MTNVQIFAKEHAGLEMDEWVEAYMLEFGSEYEWAVLKYNQTH